MSSIPLPALDLKTPQQPSLLNQYAQLEQLRSMQQQQAEAPLRQQALQNQVQSSGLQVQQQQQQLKDQQAMTSAMQNWDGKDYNDLVPLVMKHGGSAQAVIGLKKNILDQQTQIATANKDNSQATEAQVTATGKKNDIITGALSPLLDPSQVPDQALPQTLLSTVQSLQQQGLLDPQHAQKAAALAQSGDPTAIRQGIDLFRKTLMAQSQIQTEALQTAQTQAAKSTDAKNQAEIKFYQQNGGAPGVPVEAQQQAAWLHANPGKTPADYKLWTLQHTPSAMVMGNQMGGDANSQALDFAANNYRMTGQMPPGLSRSPGSTIAIIQRAAQLDQQAGGQGIATNKSVLDANRKSLDNVQKQFDTVNAFENTAGKNIDMALQKAAAIPDLGSRFANTPVRMINEKMLGTREMAEFRAALTTAQTESAKVLNSANASGVLSDTARKELEDVTNGNLSLNAMKGQWGVIKQDMQNRHDSYQQQIGDIQKRLGGSPAVSQQPAPNQSSGNDPFAQFGGKAH